MNFWLCIELCFDGDDSGDVQSQFRKVSNLTVQAGWSVLAFWVLQIFRKDKILKISEQWSPQRESYPNSECWSDCHDSQFRPCYLVVNENSLLHYKEQIILYSNYRSSQLKMLQVLIIQVGELLPFFIWSLNSQTLLPVIFVYTPFTFAIWLPLFGLGDSLEIAEYSITHTSFFPAWDAIVIILLMSDYRRGLFAMFTRKNKVHSRLSTVWKTQVWLKYFVSNEIIWEPAVNLFHFQQFTCQTPSHKVEEAILDF